MNKRCVLRIMWRALLVFVTTLTVHCEPQTGFAICRNHSTFRQAADGDITVSCRLDSIYISILLCPIYYSGFNESLMALSGKFNTPACLGIADLNASTPVLKFLISAEERSLCDNSLELTDEAGTEQLSDSRVQFVNISGSIISWEPPGIPLTYHQKLIYHFSCHYVLQYLVNDTKVNVSDMTLAARENRASFIRAIHMNLFTNRQFTQPLKIPEKGLQMKTRIYVQVKAVNLINRLNVLLERCFTTRNPYPTSTTYYDLFAGCRHDGQTVVYLNGVSQEARFSFEAFHFAEPPNRTASMFYLHCVTRLCENSTCPSMLPNCIKKVRRALQLNQYLSSVETVSSGPIKTRHDSAASTHSEYKDCVVGVAILMCLLSVCCTGLVVQILIYRRRTCFY